MKLSNLTITLLIILINVSICAAQKSGAQQEKSVNLPTGFKIDGKATEWGGKLTLSNKNTGVLYNLADNNDYLYLAVQASDPLIQKKIISGGITFTICQSGERNDPAPVAITFPLIVAGMQTGITKSVNELNDKNVKLNKDSIILSLNKKFTATAKAINVKGFKGALDSTLSIYNNLGIRIGLSMDSKATLTYELLIPLKLLTAIRTPLKQLAYNVMLNGASTLKKTNVGTASVVTTPRGLANNENDSIALQYPTDFWAKYVLNASVSR
jgi:hypothetical protein